MSPKVTAARGPAREALAEGRVMTKAVMRAAGLLVVPQSTLSRILGVSEASVSRMGAGTYLLTPGEKSFELAVLFVRLFRSLDAVAGGDAAVARAWMRNPNTVLGDAPLALVQTVSGLVNVVAYLDASRARV
jgi:uncharacterized protein (DUF2384 family)